MVEASRRYQRESRIWRRVWTESLDTWSGIWPGDDSKKAKRQDGVLRASRKFSISGNSLARRSARNCYD